ncbi:DUF1349 domain-containing protein [Lachnoclostridium phytofermentans]|uniref:DUF1349 domain-containing protein n=1 Tax=Lachnoclostridium phytofermentans (strain ATCC 700394 / DSM 18823 / ISDg) TaxID=357809 RepID=A9KPR0_LACP7|nr:DUF1349 domain-containing protein [Lachnoclostridium phytofermentans]ABX41809.1 protein of unknown function DUF1349 [Lachnoclostridium phytofermentans ISDg]
MNYNDFQWTIETQYEVVEDGIHIYAPAKTDYFVNPADGKVVTDAPFFYKEVEGDFVLRAKVSHDFVSTYDACVLLALENEKLWAKACFEYTDLGTHSVVTVMTNERSDDANGVDVDGDEVWLQLSRKDNLFAIHYSQDGKEFKMARLCNLPMQKKIKVGLEAQSPTGDGGSRRFSNVSLELRSLEDIRKGN